MRREEALLRYRINYEFNNNNNDGGGDNNHDVGVDREDEIDGRPTV